MKSLIKLAMAGSQATWVAVALNLRDISGSRIPNDHVQPPMMAKLTMKQPEKATLLIMQSYSFGLSFVCFNVYGSVVGFFTCIIHSCSRNHSATIYYPLQLIAGIRCHVNSTFLGEVTQI